MKRYLKYDVMRILSISMVLMVHVTAYIIIPLLEPGHTFESAYILSAIGNGLARFAVPVFMMMSGALVLNEEKKSTPMQFYRTALRWMFLIYLFWLIVYGLFYSQVLPYDTSFVDYLLSFQGSYPHLWYLHFVLLFYLAAPLLRQIVKKENERMIGFTILACLGLSFIGSAFKLITLLTGHKTYVGTYHVEIYANFIALILAGWYLDNHCLSKFWKRTIYSLGALSMVVIVAVTWFQYELVEEGGLLDFVSEAFTIPAALYGIAVFSLVKDVCGAKATESGLVRKLSELSFGVYIIHVFFLEWITCFLWPFDPASHQPLVYILAVWILVGAASILCAFILSKIKFVKKLIYCK